jgi:hypothetical protein
MDKLPDSLSIFTVYWFFHADGESDKGLKVGLICSSLLVILLSPELFSPNHFTPKYGKCVSLE